MARTIFWSWQSDEPQRETRDIVREALKAAIEQIGAELEEAERPELDHDTKGAPGSPEIVNTILRKIKSASLFVADVTPVGMTRGKKQLPNPNVMLELGYAREVLGLDRIILVWNMALFDSSFSDLPFDLHGLGKSCWFKLAEGASKPEYREARSELTKFLKSRIEETLAAVEPAPAKSDVEWHETMPSDPSIWAEAYNPLRVGLNHRGTVDLIVAPAPRLFVRLLPARQQEGVRGGEVFFPDPPHQLKTIGYGGSGDMSSGRTGDGRFVCETFGEDRTTRSITRWYKDNGEIWGISTWSFYPREGHPQFAYDEVCKHLVAWVGDAIRSSKAAGGSGPFSIKLGAVGLNAVHWWRGRYNPGSNLFFGLSPVVITEAVLNDDERETVVAKITQFLGDLAENFGVSPLTLQDVTTFATDA